MRLFSKHMIVTKSSDMVYQIIKSSVHNISKDACVDNNISILCTKRFKGGLISSIPVKGTITQCSNFVEVTLSVHPSFIFYLGCVLCLIGILGLIGCIISNSSRWIPYIGSIFLGILVGGQFVWESKDCLDMLERKLLN